MNRTLYEDPYIEAVIMNKQDFSRYFWRIAFEQINKAAVNTFLEEILVEFSDVTIIIKTKMFRKSH